MSTFNVLRRKPRQFHQLTFLGFFGVKRRKSGDEAQLLAGQDGSNANTVLKPVKSEAVECTTKCAGHLTWMPRYMRGMLNLEPETTYLLTTVMLIEDKQ